MKYENYRDKVKQKKEKNLMSKNSTLANGLGFADGKQIDNRRGPKAVSTRVFFSAITRLTFFLMG